jgi:ABC-type transport system substrate-binding protein
VEPGRGGQEYQVVLRPEVRFHDGRSLTVRDVRYTFEQVLRSAFYFLLFSVRGADDFRAERVNELKGFRIEGDRTFSIELDEPIAFFRAILSTPGLAVVPEGEQLFNGNWEKGCAGTGPFRLIRFVPGQLVDLERNPDYWREGHPRAKRLSFHLGIDPEESRREFLNGTYTLVSDLRPTGLAELRKDPRYLAGYAELPRLSTYFVALNAHRGPLASPRLREALARALDVETLLREVLGEQITPALGLLPPNLLGKVERRRKRVQATDEDRAALKGLSLSVTVSPSYRRQYAAFWAALCSRLEGLGITLSEENSGTPEELSRTIREGRVDLAFHRWIADYPDSDSFFFSLLHAQEGVLARLCSSETMNGLLVQARRDHDPARRYAAYQAIEQELSTGFLLIPFFHEKSYRFIQPSVRDLRLGMCSPEVHYDELRSIDSAPSDAYTRGAPGDFAEVLAD